MEAIIVTLNYFSNYCALFRSRIKNLLEVIFMCILIGALLLILMFVLSIVKINFSKRVFIFKYKINLSIWFIIFVLLYFTKIINVWKFTIFQWYNFYFQHLGRLQKKLYYVYHINTETFLVFISCTYITYIYYIRWGLNRLNWWGSSKQKMFLCLYNNRNKDFSHSI